MKHSKTLTTALCSALAAFCAASAAATETKGPVTDDIGVLVIPKGAPIQIGAYWVVSGADSALGIDEKRGVEIAIKDQAGTLLGHPIKLNVKADRPRRRSSPPIPTPQSCSGPPVRAQRRLAHRFFGRPASRT
jgi:branched-chain amino acid transport system substrate-binding protein